MAKFLRFDGRVALVTGAGNGLGKEYALMLASRGAKVVVNDLGGNMHGEGKSSGRPADEVVSIIKSKGGTAVPNYDSVEDGDKLVKTAIDNFGRLDILVNNAGILRDRTLIRMSDADWDLVYRVHLKGSFKVTRAAFSHMKNQKYGRIVMTTSPSGLYGNFGQANYSAAKMGVVGFASTVAKEGVKYNILCNTVAPQAWSRLTEKLYPPMMEEFLKTEDVAPLVSFLCHENCQDNGSVMETGGGWISKVMIEGSEGVVLAKPFTVEDVEKAWSKICDMNNSHRFTGAEGMATILPRLQEAAGQSSPDSDGGESAVGKPESVDFNYTTRDVILYALGIGCTLSQTDTADLKYLYEGHPDFSVIPSFAVIAAQGVVMNGGVFRNGIPGIKSFNLAQALHGEQHVELLKPLPPSGVLRTEGRIVEALDKKSGALITVETISKDESGDVVAINQFATFIIGAGGFGGKRKSDYLKPIQPTPKRAPDASRRCKTLTSQAALYRLNGDYNPLHVDGEFAKLGGFQTPILHGLCSYGIATRHVLREYCGDDVTKVKGIKARFSKPVIPGDTIQTDMWKEGNRIHFTCKVVETGNECLSGGYIDVTDTVSPTAAALASPGTDQSVVDSLESTVVFNQLKEHLSSTPSIVNKVKAIFMWNITKDGKSVSKWTADLKNGSGSIYQGKPKGEKAACVFTMSNEDLVALAMGKMDPQQAFFKGKMKIAGNIMLAQKLQALFPSPSQAKL